ncbi:Hypothetical protein R9X50_00622400 [Acrodontium crateriforme]|uniref:FYVE-type domain-containing protein n=1 Tax=Acrodontium crateriforme TaxID=150365 RepID=A0AAQ3RBG8_9PEZI|nr:Hypothetical protein R9X50_00622400 [Acrodontium crateriforme]
MMAATAFNPPPTTTFNNYTMTSAGPSPPDYYSKPATPPNNISPTSLHSANAHVRQLRQPRQPMYIPAALRPSAPDTPPASKDNSFDSGKIASPSSAVASSSPPDSQLSDSQMSMLKRGLSYAGSESFSDDLEHVTGQPTTAHWKPDASGSNCSVCHQAFTWFFRRHHCRRCGDLVCDAHSRRRIPLDQNARPHPNGTESKACDPCAEEWQMIKRLRHSRTNSIASSQNGSQGTAIPHLDIPKLAKEPDDMHVGSMARSEGGMHWSTF